MVKKNKKMPKFGTKMPSFLFGVSWARILKKLLWYLKSVPSLLSNCKVLQEKQKCLNLGPRILYFIFGYFWAKILKCYCDIWNQHPWICLNAKFREKIKMPNFVTKNALLRSFWARKFKKLLSYLKPATSNLSRMIL